MHATRIISAANEPIGLNKCMLVGVLGKTRLKKKVI